MLKIPSSWSQVLESETQKQYYKNILDFLSSEKKDNYINSSVKKLFLFTVEKKETKKIWQLIISNYTIFTSFINIIKYNMKSTNNNALKEGGTNVL